MQASQATDALREQKADQLMASINIFLNELGVNEFWDTLNLGRVPERHITQRHQLRRLPLQACVKCLEAIRSQLGRAVNP